MRWSTEKRHERKRAKAFWHSWFAWFPIRIAHSHEYRWLERVIRRRNKFREYTYRDPSYLIAVRLRQSLEREELGRNTCSD